jgi:hypothetical protein
MLVGNRCEESASGHIVCGSVEHDSRQRPVKVPGSVNHMPTGARVHRFMVPSRSRVGGFREQFLSEGVEMVV